MQIKALVMDMDGTLLDSKNQILPETLDAILECQKKGIKVVLASGRNYGRIKPYLDMLQLEKYNGLLIEINGIAIYDVQAKERNILKQLYEDDVYPLFSDLMTWEAETIAVWDNGLFDYMHPKIYEMKKELRKTLNLPEDFPWTAGPWDWFTDMRGGYPEQVYIQKVEEIKCPINKIQILQEEDIILEYMDKLNEKYGDKYEIFRSAPKQIEMGPLGYNKGDTLQRIMDQYGWTKDDVFVFGDGGNDISMFNKSNYSFAMGQAKDDIKEKAKYVTGTNNEQGILQALKKFEIL